MTIIVIVIVIIEEKEKLAKIPRGVSAQEEKERGARGEKCQTDTN